MIFQLLLLIVNIVNIYSHDNSTVISSIDNYITSLEGSYNVEYNPCKHNDNNCCYIDNNKNEVCSFNNMENNSQYLVYPGNNTRCMFSDSGDFAFQVIPGETDKLLFYFQGGGACWDELSTKLRLCRSRAIPNPALGVFNRKNSNNKFSSYTLVNVLYCSGDVHGGNVVHDYTDSNGVPVEQRGLANTQAVLDWVVEQQTTGAMAPILSDLVISGGSAGSIGSQIWSKQILNTIKYERAAVVPDSYLGLFPDGATGPLVKGFGFCDSGFLSPELYAKCMDETILMSDIALEFIAATPDVPYAFMQSKTDEIQQLYYDALALLGNYGGFINPTDFYAESNEILSLYNSKLSNFVIYLVDGFDHEYTPRETFYTADPVGHYDRGSSSDGIMIRDWMAKFPLKSGESIDSVCEGSYVDSANEAEDNKYCMNAVVPKQYTQV